MSDEIRTDDEDVEAHGPLFDAPPAEAPTAGAASDEEPDVEAHGPVGAGPAAMAPPAEAPPAE